MLINSDTLLTNIIYLLNRNQSWDFIPMHGFPIGISKDKQNLTHYHDGLWGLLCGRNINRIRKAGFHIKARPAKETIKGLFLVHITLD